MGKPYERPERAATRARLSTDQGNLRSNQPVGLTDLIAAKRSLSPTIKNSKAPSSTPRSNHSKTGCPAPLGSARLRSAPSAPLGSARLRSAPAPSAQSAPSASLGFARLRRLRSAPLGSARLHSAPSAPLGPLGFRSCAGSPLLFPQLTDLPSESKLAYGSERSS